ncbi:TonB-dependent receptor [Puia sp.]|uniref:SusC/RagA family TonB-linked outer membrane protein n=1 Tax=Puia sp. TaxID=2045100 RepID=UPI002F42DD87
MRHPLLLLMLLLSGLLTRAQNRTIHGTVVDEKGNPLAGVTLTIKGTPSATATDEKGLFHLSGVPEGATLVATSVGFASQEIKTKGHNTFTLVMKDAAGGLNEVVVVGYGTQKKVDLTGAIDQVGKEVFENRPLPNVTRGLEGVIPNLNIKMTDGKPIRSSDYNVRGTTSIGAGGSALIMIDGVPGDPNMLNPDDIENVTVLKDAASAAIYGARGAFGVILITTKSPRKGRTQLNFSSSLTFSTPTIKPKFVTDGYTWTKNFDSAYYAYYDYKSHPAKANSVFPFSLDYLDALHQHDQDPSLPKTAIDPTTGNYVYYGNSDWQKLLYANSDPSTDQSLSVSGGNDKASYYLSGHYQGQRGIFRYSPDTYKMYNLRSKGTVNPFPWLKLEDNLLYSRTTYFYPIINHADSVTPIWRRISDEFFPVAMLFNPDHSLTQNAAITMGSFVSGNNYSNQTTNAISNTAAFTAKFLKDRLRFHGDLTFGYTNYLESRLFTPVPYEAQPGVVLEMGDSRMNQTTNTTNYLGANLYTEYERSFGKHYFKGLVGYNYEHSLLKSNYVQRYGLINPSLPDFSLIDGQAFSLTGGGSEWKTLGGFFRFNYNFDERYLFEVNGRYDGSSKFPTNQQYGFFPSASAGWRVSREKFWNVPASWISDFKVRGSYGTLGNGNVSPYQYLETMAVSKLAMVIAGITPDATQNPNVIPDGLTWEKSTSTNIGTDISFLNNHLSAAFDWYTRYTNDMFTTGLPLPAVFGATVPKGNYASLKTQGWELSLTWHDQIGSAKPFRYSLHFILSDNVSHITKYNNPTGLISTYYKGMKVGDIWGYVNDGVYQDADDIAKHADQTLIRVSSANQPLPGDIKFKDRNGDGKITPGDGTVTNPGDMKIIGNSAPRLPFGFNASADWNNFFFSAFFQGIWKRNWWPGTDASLFWGQYNRPYSWMPQDVLNHEWSPTNPNGYFPRLRGYVALNASSELVVKQTKYLQNTGYVRLKNLTFGYSLPASLIGKAGISSAKIYVTGQNLWVWSPMYKIIRTMDPEVIDGSDPELTSGAGNGMAYPMMKTYTIGINVTF